MKKRLLCTLLALILCTGLAIPAVAAPVADLKLLTEPDCVYAGEFSDGLIYMVQGTTVRYYDTNGNVVIDDALKHLREYLGEEPDLNHVDIGDFHDGVAIIVYFDFDEYDDVVVEYAAVIDKTGNLLFHIPGGMFYYIGEYSNGYILALSIIDDSVTAYDKQGNSVELNYPVTFGDVSDSSWARFYDSLMPYYEFDLNGNVKEGYLDKNFNVAIQPVFDVAYPFYDGLAFVAKDGKFGVIDKTGTFVIQPQFDDFAYSDECTFQSFSEGLASVLKDGKWGYIDTKGNTVIPFIFDESMGLFNGGYAASANSGCIDKTGKTVISPDDYDDINPPVNGVALVGNNGTYKIIDLNGNAVSTKTWQFSMTMTNNALTKEGLYLYWPSDDLFGLAKLTFTESSYTATPTTATVIIDGIKIDIGAYNINGNNYFKLRDMAYSLGNTEKQFEIEWDAATASIYMTSNEVYTVVGGEMQGRGTTNKTATSTNANTYLDGERVYLTAFNIDGNNYFKLRDLGDLFDFGIDWNGETNTITIDTTKGYTVG